MWTIRSGALGVIALVMTPKQELIVSFRSHLRYLTMIGLRVRRSLVVMGSTLP
jgi:hypothetical protein